MQVTVLGLDAMIWFDRQHPDFGVHLGRAIFPRPKRVLRQVVAGRFCESFSEENRRTRSVAGVPATAKTVGFQVRRRSLADVITGFRSTARFGRFWSRIVFCLITASSGVRLTRPGPKLYPVELHIGSAPECGRPHRLRRDDHRQTPVQWRRRIGG